jgi:hypothetical protein
MKQRPFWKTDNHLADQEISWLFITWQRGHCFKFSAVKLGQYRVSFFPMWQHTNSRITANLCGRGTAASKGFNLHRTAQHGKNAPSGFQTHDRSVRGVQGDKRLTPCGHWDWHIRHRGSSVNKVTRLWAGRPEFNSRKGLRLFISTPPRPDRLSGPLSLLSNGYWGFFPWEVKRPGREADHSLPYSKKVKLFLCFNWTPRHEGVLGSGGTPRILWPRR